MNGRGGGYAFLVELIAVVLFFSLSALVVLTLFLGADQRAREAERLSGAILAAGSAAEIVRTSKDPVADFTAHYGALEAQGGYEAWLDPSFLPGGLMEYILRLECTRKNGLYEMTLAVLLPDGERIYSLTCASYAGGAG